MVFLCRLCSRRCQTVGNPQIVRGRAVYSDSVGYFGKKAAGLASLGVSILGGCCGTTPEYIREIAHVLQDGVSSPDGERFLRIRPTEGRRRAGKKADRDDLATAKKSVSEGREQHTEKKIVSEGRKQQIEKKAVSEKKHVADGETPAENTFSEKLKKGEPVIAVELDPPFDTDMKKLLHRRAGADGHGDGYYNYRRFSAGTVQSGFAAHSGEDPAGDRHGCDAASGLPGQKPHRASEAVFSAPMSMTSGICSCRDRRPGGTGRDGSFTKSVFDFNSIKLMEFLQSLNGELFAESPALLWRRSESERRAARIRSRSG